MRLGASDGQAEEVLQEALLTVWRKAHLFDRKKAAASTWIFTIARNRRIDILRKRKFPEIDAEDPSLVPDAPRAPDEEVIGAREGEAVRAALEKLPDEQRELVRLAFYNGWSHSKIAKTPICLWARSNRACGWLFRACAMNWKAVFNHFTG